MKKFLKISGIVVGALLGLVVVLFFALKLISDDQYKEWITSGVKSATGRDFSIGSMAIDLNTSLNVKANDVRMANADWGSKPDMLTAGDLEAEVSLTALLTGVADIRMILKQAEILAVKDADGVSNWALGAGEPDPEKPRTESDAGTDDGGLPIRPLIREIRIEDFALTLLDGPGAVERTARIERLLIETPEEDTSLSLDALVGKIPVELAGNLGPVSEVLDRQSSPIKLDGKIGDNILGVSGDWGPLLPDPNMALNLKVQIPSTAQMISAIGYELKELGVAEIDAALAAKDGKFSVARMLTNLDGDVASLSVDGSISDLIDLNGIDIAARAQTSGLNKLLKRLNLPDIPVELPPNVEVSANVSGSLDGLSVKDFVAKIVDEGMEVSVTGSVENALAPTGIDATVTANVESTNYLSRYAGLAIPDLGSIDLTARVTSVDDTVSLHDLDGGLKSDNIRLSLTGGVADLISVSGIDASLDSDISGLTDRNIAEIETLLDELDLQVPLDMLPQSIKLSAVASGDRQHLAVRNIDGEVRDEGIRITLKGGVDDVLKQEGVKADLTFRSESIAALSKYARTELPEVGSLDVAASIGAEGKTFRLDKFDAKLAALDFQAVLNAAVQELRIDELTKDDGLNTDAISGISVKLESNIDSLAALSELARTQLPASDPITINAVVEDGSDGDKKSATAVVNIATAGATLVADALLADISSPDHLDVDVVLEAESLSDFDKLAQKELPDKGPLKLSGTARARANEYGLEDLQLTLDDQSANGFFGITLAESDADNHTLRGELNIPYLDLSPMLAGASEQEEPTEQPEDTTTAVEPATKDVREEQEIAAAEVATKSASERLFPTDPIPLELMRKIDAELSVTSQRLVLGKTTMTDFTVAMSLKEGLLSIDPIESLAGNGTIDGSITLDGRTDVADLGVHVIMDDIPMPNLGGGLKTKIWVDGTGASVADLMASLDGQFIVVIRDGTIPHGFATNFGSGLFSFSGGKEETQLECGILRMDIEDGKVDFDDKLAVQLTDVTWRGGGEIDLATEELDVGIAPKPRKGVGISAGSLASLVHVGGTLKNPSVQLDPTDVALKYGKYMAAVSTGGLTILAGALFNKSQANEDVCQVILSGAVFDEEAAGDSEADGTDDVGTSEEPASDDDGSESAPEEEASEEEKKVVPKNLQ